MSNTRETISLKTIIMTQNITKRQGKRKGKGKDTCDAFFPLSLSLSSLSLRSWKTNAKKKKKKKKRRKKAGDPRQRLMDLGSFFFLFFSRDRNKQFLFFTRKETDRTIPFCRSVSPQRKEKERARREPQQRLIYIHRYRYRCAYGRSNLPPQSALK